MTRTHHRRRGDRQGDPRRSRAPRSRGSRRRGVTPGLAVVLVGENPGQQGLRRQQGEGLRRSGHALGRTIELPAETTEAELLAAVDRLNADPAIHGILVQLPLPKQINSDQVLQPDRSRPRTWTASIR